MFKHIFYGFVFGAAVLHVINALALAVPFFGTLAGFLMIPGRFLAGFVTGPDALAADMAIVTVLNGTVYALVFMTIGFLFRKEGI